MLDDWTLSLLTNRDVLEMMQETCRGTQITRTDDYAVWKNKDRASGRMCVALFNLSDADKSLSVGLSELEENTAAGQERKLFELWEKKEYVTVSGRIEASVPAHGVKVYRVG